MKIALMQPYLFAYIGYYQLIGAVDLYVMYDDVQYIRNGWINRNRLLFKDEARYFIFSVKGDALTLKINERVFCEQRHEGDKKRLLKTLDWYRQAPHYAAVFEVIRSIMQFEDTNVARFIINSIREICRYLDIKTPIEIASQVNYVSNFKRQERVIDMSRWFKADEYINAIGGTAFYSKEEFAHAGITLRFLRTRDINYKQFGQTFVPNLSILDVLMFNPKEKVQELLTQYDLI
jgi:hypothetical protein